MNNPLLNNVKFIQGKRLNLIDVSLLVPSNKWLSFHEDNLKICTQINRDIYRSCNVNILSGNLSLSQKPKDFIKYVRPSKFNEDAFNLVKEILMEYEDKTENDISILKKTIMLQLNNKDVMSKFCGTYGLNNKQRKILGLSNLKLVTPKKKKTLF